jgi:hypothetical protein
MQFHELTVKQMQAEGWGVRDITPYELEVEYQCGRSITTTRQAAAMRRTLEG